MAESRSFTLSCRGGKVIGPKTFTLAVGKKAVRIGRAPGNDLVLDFRGVSQYHAEVRLLKEGLCIRDLSMNGTGLKKPEGSKKGATAELLKKNTDQPLPHGCEILVPMMLKENTSANERGWITVQYVSTEETPAPSKAKDEAEAEKKRMQFVELLLKTREVSAGTKYEEARGLLGKLPAWHAVEETTRRECFEIFVEHLGSHDSKEKKKKEKGGKDKEKKHKGRKEGGAKETYSAAEAEVPRKKRSRSRSGAKAKRGKRDRDRGAGSGSGSRGRSRGRDREGDGGGKRRRHRARS